MTEMYKTKFDLNPPFMKDIFKERNISYNLRRGNDAQIPKVRTTSFGIESIAYLGNKLWQLLPLEIKQSNTLPIFKKRIRCWKGDKCNCRLCKTYIPKVGFLARQMFLSCNLFRYIRIVNFFIYIYSFFLDICINFQSRP